jgi:hypothetical protein
MVSTCRVKEIAMKRYRRLQQMEFALYWRWALCYSETSGFFCSACWLHLTWRWWSLSLNRWVFPNDMISKSTRTRRLNTESYKNIWAYEQVEQNHILYGWNSFSSPRRPDRFHPAFYPDSTADTQAGACRWPLTPIYWRHQKCVDLYNHSPIRLYGKVHN